MFPEALSDSDREIILRCLAKDPDERFQTVEALLRSLQAPVALGESLVFNTPPPSPGAQTAEALGGLRDPKDSPYGLPWNDGARSGGLLGGLVHLIFKAFELVIFVMLLPVRAISAFSGRGLVYVLTLPFRVLGFIARVAGYAIITFLALALVLAFLSVAA